MSHRVAIQADKAEFSTQILLRRECQRHQDTDMGDSNRQSAHYTVTEGSQTLMELLRACNNRQNNADVLY